MSYGPPASGYFWIDNRAADKMAAREVSPTDFAVYSFLVRHAFSRRCSQSLTSIAQGCRLCDRTIRRSVGVLEKRGLVKSIRECGRPSAYEITNLDQSRDTPDTGARGTPDKFDRGTADTPGANVRPPLASVSGVSETHNLLTKSNKTKERERTKREQHFDLLDQLIDVWNSTPRALVSSHVKNRRAKPIVDGWQKLLKCIDPGEIKPGAVAAAIQTAAFCRGQDWFRFAWLFTKDRAGEWRIVKLLEGAYVNNRVNGHQSRARIHERDFSQYGDRHFDEAAPPGEAARSSLAGSAPRNGHG